MPFDITWTGPSLLVVGRGAVSVDEIAALVHEICSSPEFDNLRCQLFDFGQVELPEYSPELLTAVAPVIGATRSNAELVVACIPDTPAMRHLVERNRPVLGGLRAFELFANRAAAADWLAARASA